MNLRKWTPHILGIFLIVALGIAAMLYRQLQDARANPQRIAQEEVKTLVARIQQLIVLPEGEDPTVATVRDTEKLKTQPFFTQARVGDKVLIYTNAKKAILYNPTSNKIVEVAPISIGNPAAPAGGDVSP